MPPLPLGEGWGEGHAASAQLGVSPATKPTVSKSARLRVAAVLVACVFLVLSSTLATAADPKDYAVPDGRYFEQGVPPGTPEARGFAVLDDDAAPLWAEFRRLGGVELLGYPISDRYDCDRATCQAFQHAVLKWSAGAAEAEPLSILDHLHADGHDGWLDQVWGIPPWDPGDAEARARKKAEQGPLAGLGVDPSIASAYRAIGDAAPALYGQPRAYRASEGGAVLRTQRTAFLRSAESPDQVRRLQAGLVFRDAGLVPAPALAPMAAPEPSAAAAPRRISIPALGIDAPVIGLDMSRDGELPVPTNGDVVAWYSYSARPGERGNAVLAGHVDWDQQLAVFWRLREARPGQQIALYGDADRPFTYEVESVQRHPAESPEVLAALRPGGDRRTITLVTCGGRFDATTRSYDDRYVVRAALVDRGR